MSQPFIRIRDLHQTFGSQQVLRGINLDIFRGETLVLLGTSGGGKSVLAKHLPVLLRPQQGEIWIDDVEITRLRERELGPIRHQIGMMFQGGALFDSFTVFENVAFPLREDKSLKESEIRRRVTEALEIVKLAEHAGKFPSDISGGMRKRVALGQALVTMPDMLLLDEPTNHLDLDSIQWLEDLLIEFKGSMVVITHDRTFLDRVSTRIVELDRGKLTSWACDYDTYLERKTAYLDAEVKQWAAFDKKLVQEEAWLSQGV
jgi:phospholipid/cholesterol/gamma-HCH transport system ATP-binding protein